MTVRFRSRWQRPGLVWVPGVMGVFAVGPFVVVWLAKEIKTHA